MHSLLTVAVQLLL